ncbi:MAG: outer membrane beta-barrel protein [Reichenbachiella sp.]|uniref:outer membrane beta-barrel protein n=1 Tax=Reichenbachiella sp. TaxID=2184521 RepID=UPI0032650201
MKRISIMILVLTMSCSLLAQDDQGPPKGEFWIGLQFAIPVGTFAVKIERNLGYGGNLGGVWNPSKFSNFFQVGLDLGVNYMGKNKTEIAGIPMKTTNTLITTHLVTRFRVQTSSHVKPYVDLMGGGKFISTTTKYNNDLLDTILEIEDESVFADQTNGVWSYGIGIGFSFRKKFFGADFRMLYLASGPLEYISPKNLKQDIEGNFFYEYTEISRTHMVFPQVSVSFDL